MRSSFLTLFCALAIQAIALPLVDAQEPAPSGLISAANHAMQTGEYRIAEEAVLRVVDHESASKGEQAEAFRILALIKFYEGALQEARSAFLDYLRLDPDAHLDPALVPPEAVTLFEDVRAQNLAELDAYRERPKNKRYVLLNLVPSGGQFQNGERTSGLLIATGIGALLVTNLSSYFVLKSFCDHEDRTCSSNGMDKTSTARNLQAANLLSGIGLVSLYAYSVIDGYLGYRRLQRRDALVSLQLRHEDQGAALTLSFDF